MKKETLPVAPAADAPSSAPSVDVALVHGVAQDGSLRVIRRRGDEVELGAVQPLKEGAPLHGEVVSLKPRREFPLLCDVEVHYSTARQNAGGEARVPARSTQTDTGGGARRKGPPQVANNAYRANWDAIWNASRKPDSLN